MKRFILLFILCALVLYAAGGFILLDWNACDWGESGRAFYVAEVFLASIAIAFLTEPVSRS